MKVSERQILAFAAVHRLIALDQVKVLLGNESDAAEGYLDGLVATGLLGRDSAGPTGPAAFRITQAGLAALGSGLPAPSPSERWRHDAAVGWLWIAATRGRFGPFDRLWTEREIRDVDSRAGVDRRFGFEVASDNRAGGLHYPDLLLVGDWGRAAFELEVSHGEARRLEAVLGGYARQRSVRVVIYLVSDLSIGREVERTAQRLGLSELVRVQQFTVASALG